MLKAMLGQYPAVYQLVNRLRGVRIHDPNRRVPYEMLGGDPERFNYGEWAVPLALLNETSIVYSVGVGDDISFDRALIDRYGCEVFAYDPSPTGVAFAATQELPDRFHFAPIGLSNVDGEAEFFAGPDTSFGLNNPGTDKALVLPVRRLATLKAQNAHAHIDLLKMDIEGFEYDVIEDIAKTVRPTCILVEFHHKLLGRTPDTKRAVAAVLEAGYDLFWVSDYGADYGFILR